jgi:hypothetical protein
MQAATLDTQVLHSHLSHMPSTSFAGIGGTVRSAWSQLMESLRLPVFATGSARWDASQAADALAQFRRVLTNAHARSILREQLAREEGHEALEFLIAVRSFEEAKNALQRFQLLSNLVHRFVGPGAERIIPVSQGCRQAMLTEWTAWAHKERVPAQLPFESLEAAAAEINEHLDANPAKTRSLLLAMLLAMRG